MASFVAIFSWARIQTSSSMHIRRSPSSHSSIASVILLIVNPSSSSSLSGDFSFSPFPGLHMSGHRENSRFCFFQSMVGLCAFNQSYPRNALSFPSWVTPNEINSTCSFMIIQVCTISLMEPFHFHLEFHQHCRLGLVVVFYLSQYP